MEVGSYQGDSFLILTEVRIEVDVLIDCYSTHNFIHHQIVEKLGLAIEPVPPFRVYVGNRDLLHCDQQSKAVQVNLQGTTFIVDLYVLRIHGHDVVLGVTVASVTGEGSPRLRQGYDGVCMGWRHGHPLGGESDGQDFIHASTPGCKPNMSKKRSPKRLSASAYHKELYAIVEAVQKWQQYLLGREFLIRTDQKSLRELLQQTKVINCGVEHYLRAFTPEKPEKWTTLFPWVEYALNTSHHQGLKMTPFEALYGRPPPSLLPYKEGNSKVAEVDGLLSERDTLFCRLKEHLHEEQQRIVEYANRHRREVQFEVGDLVLLKLQPYRKHSVARCRSQKLARHYYGPYQLFPPLMEFWEENSRFEEKTSRKGKLEVDSDVRSLNVREVLRSLCSPTNSKVISYGIHPEDAEAGKLAEGCGNCF
ncbi:unnamed protein product [Cuscuta campestris]|uniref:Reverse transcriptase RNase H-like domain-containing protein n=1 Tax=Cuscuta campestris TaxID=132261 RepID=A0A484L0E7_9ASTE|nr:unnamed protein product [Cuscuta campestris]